MILHDLAVLVAMEGASPANKKNDFRAPWVLLLQRRIGLPLPRLVAGHKDLRFGVHGCAATNETATGVAPLSEALE